MKAKAVYLNYNEESRTHYYTIYLYDNTKVYIEYGIIEKAKKFYDEKLKGKKKDENNK